MQPASGINETPSMHAHTMTSPYHPSLSLGPFDLETKNDRNTKTMTSPTPSFEGPPPNQCLFHVVRHILCSSPFGSVTAWSSWALMPLSRLRPNHFTLRKISGVAGFSFNRRTSKHRSMQTTTNTHQNTECRHACTVPLLNFLNHVFS